MEEKIKLKPIEHLIIKQITKYEPINTQFLKLWLKDSSDLKDQTIKRGKLKKMYANGSLNHKEFNFRKVITFDQIIKKLKIREAMAECSYGYSSSIIKTIIIYAKIGASQLFYNFFHMRIRKNHEYFYVIPNDDSGLSFFFDSPDDGFFDDDQNKLEQFNIWKKIGLNYNKIGKWISQCGLDIVNLSEKEEEKIKILQSRKKL